MRRNVDFVRDPNRRLERAMEARDEKLMLAWLEARSPTTCPGCGRPMETVVPGSGRRGRTRVWCSDACRQRAYRARKSGAETVEPGGAAAPDSPAPAGHTLDQCIVSVLESPHAVASVLDVVRRALDDDVLGRHEYAEIQVALVALHEALNTNHR
jgi:hypothetical protein